MLLIADDESALFVIDFEGAEQKPVAPRLVFVVHSLYVVTAVIGIIRLYEGQKVVGVDGLPGRADKIPGPVKTSRRLIMREEVVGEVRLVGLEAPGLDAAGNVGFDNLLLVGVYQGSFVSRFKIVKRGNVDAVGAAAVQEGYFGTGLVGNWFQDGTGYAGGDADVVQDTCGNSPCPYWNGHLAFVYDFVPPDQVRIAIGFDTGLYPGTPYGVKGNLPDPANVSVETGLVKYELVALEDVTTDYGFVTMSMPLITRNDESRVIAVFLVEMVDDRIIKMEIFPDMTAGQVTDFSDEVKIYRR